MTINKNGALGNMGWSIINNLNCILNIVIVLSEIDDPEIAAIIDFFCKLCCDLIMDIVCMLESFNKGDSILLNYW